MKFYDSTRLTAGQQKMRARFERDDRQRRCCYGLALVAIAAFVWAAHHVWRYL